MNSRDFAYWLNGYFELADPSSGLTPEQVDCIEAHLKLVFIHEIDPSYGDKKKQDELNKVHSANQKKPPSWMLSDPGAVNIRC